MRMPEKTFLPFTKFFFLKRVTNKMFLYLDPRCYHKYEILQNEILEKPTKS